MAEYEHNSPEKKFIRDQWVDFAKQIYDETKEFSMLGFPSVGIGIE